MENSMHAYLRGAQRNLLPEDIEYVERWGQEFRRDGAVITYLRDRDIPHEDRADDRRMRLAGTAVVKSPGRETCITTWRNRRRGLKVIKRKPDYDSRTVRRL